MSNDSIFDLAHKLGLTRSELEVKMTDAGVVLMKKEADRGDGRKAHYGSGRQPLDDIVDAGWGAAFCAGNVLKYLRRDKQVEDSRAKAKWYWNFMNEVVKRDPEQRGAKQRLVAMLSNDELQFLLGIE